MRISISQIENQYYKANLFEDICSRLEQQGIDLARVGRHDLSGVDELHVRGAEVSNELVNEIYLKDARVLDVGCGLGGPARMLADRFNCRVTGIDLCEEYVRTARQLSELVGLSEQTIFVHGDALEMPFADGSFDIVWTQHVQMNIRDKAAFYSEIKRVLTDEGALVYYDIFKKNGGNVQFPVPWADTSAVSFLETVRFVDALLNELGFVKSQTSDQTLKAGQFLAGLLEKVKNNGLPVLGLDVLMGRSTKKKLINVLKAIEENRIVLQSGIYRKKYG